MFKDYYLILGIGKDATPEEIEKAFKDTDAKFNGNLSSVELQEAKEAFSVLSHQETKILYDKELEKRIVRAIKEKQSRVYEIKRMKDLLEFL